MVAQRLSPLLKEVKRMKRSTKMLMMAGGNKRDQEYNRGYRMEYGPEDKFRDRRGREHYDNGRYAPQS